jgi:integrase
MEAITLREYALDWLRARTDLKRSTRDLYARCLDGHILPFLGDQAVAALRPLIIKQWYAGRGKATGRTAQAQAYRLLRAILNEAVRDEVIGSNPCTIRGGGQDHHEERQPIAVHEIPVLAARMPERYQFLIYAAAWSGLREGELLALQRRHVQVSEGRAVFHVERNVRWISGEWVVSTPKTKAGVRAVALPPHLVPLLEDHLARFVDASETALVFSTSTGRYVPGPNLCTMLRRARAAIGRPDLHFHDLRHTAATLAASTGASAKELMVRIGHVSPRAAMIYQHAVQGRDVEIAESLSQLAAQAGNVIPLRLHG